MKKTNNTQGVIFLAKKISDEAFMLGKNLDKIKVVAVERYEKLKDITLN